MDFLEFTKSPLYGEIQAALKRIGDRRLAWLMDFLRVEVDGLRSGELLDLSHEVLAFAGTWGAYHALAKAPLDGAVLKRLQGAVGAGVTGLFQKAPRPWVPELGRVKVAVQFEPGSYNTTWKRPRLHKRDSWPFHEGEADMILARPRMEYQLVTPSLKDLFLLAAAEEVQRGAGSLRRCWECTKPFVRFRKQRYCSPSCAQRARDKRRRPKRAK
jgi:hypothetical protein